MNTGCTIKLCIHFLLTTELGIRGPYLSTPDNDNYHEYCITRNDISVGLEYSALFIH